VKNLMDYFDAVKAGLLAEFQKKGLNFSQVEFYDDTNFDKLEDVSIIIDFPGLDENKEADSAGRNNEKVSVQLHCIYSKRVPRSQLRIISFASLVKRLVLRQKWGLGKDVENPTNIVAYPSDFKRGEEGRKCWTVEFDQVVKMDGLEGEEDYPVNEVYLGVNPKTLADFKLIGHLSNDD